MRRWSRLLNKVEKDPEAALRDSRCLKPKFLTELFDLCESKALEAPWTAPELAMVAVQLAGENGDPHLMSRAGGVFIHVLINNGSEEVDELLQVWREDAFECCGECASEWYRRQGDLLVETKDPVKARAYLDLSAQELGDALDDDTRGRILFVRGIAHHYLKMRDQALADVDDALQLLSLTSSHGYFPDAVSFVACFLQGGHERRHDELALDILARFRPRLKGQKGFVEVLARVRWVEGLVYARLGRTRRARERLEGTRKAHMRHSPHRYALAIAVDEALIYCRNHPETFIRTIRRIITFCKQNLKLETEHRKALLKAAKGLGQQPWASREILATLRHSYTVPVPGLLCDRVLADEEETGGAETG